ncbi:hypothetical protein, conserved [Eimeria brunetti]|uniref:Uncharacterized protein n=1 Tax=Eimeria brunetti TaxID=51314 RepID=U6LJE6_9EIME|nr:hypothetical protein, conserved [Eimeria brunetti]
MGLKGEHIVFDVQKFAKEAAQQSDEPAIAKAALQISEKAQKVTSIAKTAASSEHQEEVGAEEELDQSKEAGEENDVEGDKTNDTEKGDADEENSLGPEEFDAF